MELAADDVERLVDRWAVRRGDDDVASEVVAIEEGPRVPLVDLFPALRLRLSDEQRRYEVAWCSEVRIETSGSGGRQSETTRFHIEQDVVFVESTIDHPGLLGLLSKHLSLGLDAQRIDKIIENKLDQEVRQRIADVRRQESDALKLAVVVPAEVLEAELPAPLLHAMEDLHGTLDHVQLAELALAVYGVETLMKFSGHFEELGFQPPNSWAGSRQAVEWVRELGFSREQAGFPRARREGILEVEGPPALKELHPFQARVVEAIQGLLQMDPETERPRGMVSLPTGAGKTRVAVQALVEAFRAGTLQSPVLWVAQRDELCEQAVQAWSEVWRDQGPQERLTISRLWSSNEAEAAPVGCQVVVATIDKLDSRVMESEAYGWLSEATFLVIDEAHFAIGPSYTRLLEWQGMGRNKERIPLVGLTATPYRGTSEEETKRLVARFGERLDKVAFGDADPYRELQEMGVLSRVTHRTLKGSDIHLSDAEIDELKRTRLLPSAASDRLAADVVRNRVLLESIEDHPDDWTSLVFCTSLEHASVMAGLLTARGIPTAAVAGSTPPAARRHYIEEFRAGRIRVLTNYAVFAEGFDAPEVRAVYVARPTYSPNVYQQMVGRGLRGPRNGGSEECLIVNVEDNVVNFGEALAFRQFEHLWHTEAR
jgi:superfamily II DNA or RNA helicase